MTKTQLEEEFDHQVHTLLQKQYPKMSRQSEDDFVKRIQQLKPLIKDIKVAEIDLDRGVLPFVIVVKKNLVDTEKAVALTSWNGKQSFINMYPHTPDDFAAIDSISIPKDDIYLLIDIDRGGNTLNIPPNEALQLILQQNRSPLTIDEGVAILTHYPEFLKKNNCFSLLASRMKENKRVPALWITGEKSVRLGWCWDGNPHSWLGSASCSKRGGH